MAQKPVPAKEKKLGELFKKYGMNISKDEFIQYFQQEYPKDWNRIQERYEAQERNRKPGKAAPMPEPIKYLQNMYNVHMKKNS